MNQKTLDLVLEFHGHIGPYVVAGVRAAEIAVRILGCERHFGLEAHVESPDAPPPSCFIDGVQLGSGCTTGKRNLTHAVADGVRVEFRDRKTGRRVSLRLRPEAIAPAIERLKAEGDRAGADVVLTTPEDLLFEIQDIGTHP